MLENPFYHDEDAKMDRCLLRSFIARCLVVGGACLALAMLMSTLGCATNQPVEYCPRFTVQAMQSEQGMLFILDEENLRKLAHTLDGLNKGTCKIQPRGAV